MWESDIKPALLCRQQNIENVIPEFLLAVTGFSDKIIYLDKNSDIKVIKWN